MLPWLREYTTVHDLFTRALEDNMVTIEEQHMGTRERYFMDVLSPNSLDLEGSNLRTVATALAAMESNGHHVNFPMRIREKGRRAEFLCQFCEAVLEITIKGGVATISSRTIRDWCKAHPADVEDYLTSFLEEEGGDDY